MFATICLCTSAVFVPAGEATEITDGLVCHLTFDQDVLDHSDSSHENHGRAIGSPVHEEGCIGKALLLHGSRGECVDLGRPQDLQFGDRDRGSDFSVSLWVRIDASETWPVLITNKDYSSKPTGNSTSHPATGRFDRILPKKGRIMSGSAGTDIRRSRLKWKWRGSGSGLRWS